MANISDSIRGHLPTQVIRLVLLLIILLSLPLQAQGSIGRHDEDHLTNHTMSLSLSPNLPIIGAENLTETLAWSNDAAIWGALQPRGTRYAGEFGKSCYRIEQCGREEDLGHNACKGDTQVGFEACDKTGKLIRPICCQKDTAPKKCKWRGGTKGKDCNGRCHVGEVTLFRSKHGGGFESESGYKGCKWGQKAFCCEEPAYNELVSGCRWTKCGGKCNKDENSLAISGNFPNNCWGFTWKSHFCCPKSKPDPVKDCHWVGSGKCDENTCANYEFTLGSDKWGDGKDIFCDSNRHSSLCCQWNKKASTCSKKLCEIDNSYRCGRDEFADWTERGQEPGDPLGRYLFDDRNSNHLEERGSDRRPLNGTARVHKKTYRFNTHARSYPGATVLYSKKAKTQPDTKWAFGPDPAASCGTAMKLIRRDSLSTQQILDGFDTEHNPDLQYSTALLETAMHGILPNGTAMTTPAIDPDDLLRYWHMIGVKGLRDLKRAGVSRNIKTANDYFMDRFGSTGNREPMLLADKGMNEVKGRIFCPSSSIQSSIVFDKYLQKSLQSGVDEDNFLTPIRQAIQVFRYMNHPIASKRIQKNRRELLEATEGISATIPQLAMLHDIHREFDHNWYVTMTDKARKWVIGQLDQIENAFNQANPLPGNYLAVIGVVKQLRGAVTFMQPPPRVNV